MVWEGGSVWYWEEAVYGVGRRQCMVWEEAMNGVGRRQSMVLGGGSVWSGKEAVYGVGRRQYMVWGGGSVWCGEEAVYEGAKVSGQVVSHTKLFPCFQGTIVTPSGCLP